MLHKRPVNPADALSSAMILSLDHRTNIGAIAYINSSPFVRTLDTICKAIHIETAPEEKEIQVAFSLQHVVHQERSHLQCCHHRLSVGCRIHREDRWIAQWSSNRRLCQHDTRTWFRSATRLFISFQN